MASIADYLDFTHLPNTYKAFEKAPKVAYRWGTEEVVIRRNHFSLNDVTSYVVGHIKAIEKQKGYTCRMTLLERASAFIMLQDLYKIHLDEMEIIESPMHPIMQLAKKVSLLFQELLACFGLYSDTMYLKYLATSVVCTFTQDDLFELQMRLPDNFKLRTTSGERISVPDWIEAAGKKNSAGISLSIDNIRKLGNALVHAGRKPVAIARGKYSLTSSAYHRYLKETAATRIQGDIAVQQALQRAKGGFLYT